MPWIYLLFFGKPRSEAQWNHLHMQCVRESELPEITSSRVGRGLYTLLMIYQPIHWHMLSGYYTHWISLKLRVQQQTFRFLSSSRRMSSKSREEKKKVKLSKSLLNRRVVGIPQDGTTSSDKKEGAMMMMMMMLQQYTHTAQNVELERSERINEEKSRILQFSNPTSLERTMNAIARKTWQLVENSKEFVKGYKESNWNFALLLRCGGGCEWMWTVNNITSL